jgi:hypothetical protein
MTNAICAVCRAVILSADKRTIRGDEYHIDCWDRKVRQDAVARRNLGSARR